MPAMMFHGNYDLMKARGLASVAAEKGAMLHSASLQISQNGGGLSIFGTKFVVLLSIDRSPTACRRLRKCKPAKMRISLCGPLARLGSALLSDTRSVRELAASPQRDESRDSNMNELAARDVIPPP